MIRYILLLGIGYLLFLLWKGSLGLQKPATRPPDEDGRIDDEMVKDPVCETYVPRSIAIARKHRGVVHYFCSEQCANEFFRRAET
jgi:YHS domain-containing protein